MATKKKTPRATKIKDGVRVDQFKGTAAELYALIDKVNANQGVVIRDCNIENKAAPISTEASEALSDAAKAAEANANAIAEIARALRGADARMDAGISVRLPTDSEKFKPF